MTVYQALNIQPNWMLPGAIVMTQRQAHAFGIPGVQCRGRWYMWDAATQSYSREVT